MKRNILIVIYLLSAVLLGNAQTINTSKSYVKFEISNMKVKTVTGTIGGMKGSLKFVEKNVNASTFNVCIDPATINTRSNKRDSHLRNEDFFHVVQFPSICFTSKLVSKMSNGYLATGTLTMLGITKEVQIPFTIVSGVFQGSFSINRLDYNVGKDTGTFLVGNEVNLVIVCNTNP